MKKILLNVVGLAALFISGATQAQEYVHQVIFLNEGQYDYNNGVQVTPVTIGAYDPVTETYADFDTIWDAQFGSDVLIDGDYIYVAADSIILKYNSSTHQLVNSVIVQGTRNLAIWNDQLLVTRGNQTPYNSYFQVYDKNTLGFIYELDTQDGPSASSSDVKVYNDTAYIAINNSFDWGNYVGKLGIVDLNNQTYQAEVDLGPDAINPENIMIENGKIYTLNNKNFDGSSITSFDIATRANSTTGIAVNSSCGTSTKADGHIYFMEYSVGKLARYNLSQGSVSDTIANSDAYYGMVEDEVNGVIYATFTDYVSYGEAYILDYNGGKLDSFMVGISPGNMALDVRTSVGINEAMANMVDIYPNPTASIVNIMGLDAVNAKAINITDLSGRLVYSQNLSAVPNTLEISIDDLARGVYVLSIQTDSDIITKKVVKN